MVQAFDVNKTVKIKPEAACSVRAGDLRLTLLSLLLRVCSKKVIVDCIQKRCSMLKTTLHTRVPTPQPYSACGLTPWFRTIKRGW